MSKGARVRAACTGLAAGLLVACAMAPPLPQIPPMRMPTPGELWEMQQQASGNAPVAERQAVDGIQVVLQTGHARTIGSVAMSADGRHILSSSFDETAKVWDVASGQELRTITGAGVTGGSVAFVSGTERVVLGDSLQGRRLIDLATGRTLRELGNFGTPSAISANGRYAAILEEGTTSGGRRVTSQRSVITVLDLARDEVVTTFTMPGQAAPIAVTNDARSTVVRRLDVDLVRRAAAPFSESPWRIEIWDAGAKRPRAEFAFDSGSDGLMPALSPDGRLIATGTLSGKVRVYSTESGKPQLELAGAEANTMSSVVFSPDGRLLASFALVGLGGAREGARIWDLANGRAVAHLDASAVGFSADGQTLILGREIGGAPILRDLARGVERALAGSISAVVDLAVIGAGTSVAAATELGGVQHWDLKTGQLQRTFECPGGFGSRSVSASKTGPWLAASCNDGAVYVWNVNSGALIRTLNAPAARPVGTLASVRFDASGQRIVFAVQEQLAVWDMPADREIFRVTLPRFASFLPQVQEGAQDLDEWQNSVRAIAVHPGNQHAAVVKGTAILLVDLASGAVARRFGGEPGSSTSVPAPTTGMDQPAMLDQVLSGARLSRKQRKQIEELAKGASGPTALASMNFGDVLDDFDAVVSLQFSADGQRLFTLGSRGRKVWDVSTGRPIARPQRNILTPGTDPATFFDSFDLSLAAALSSGLAISSDGRLGASGHGKLVKLWDVADDREIASLGGHTSDITSVAYSADARLLVSGGRDGALRVWSVPERKEIVELIALGPADYVAVTPDQYYRASRRRIAGVAFRIGDRLFPFEQFDLRFNRPDIVLERLGAAPGIVQGYRVAYQRRLKKMGFIEDMLRADFHLPEIALVGASAPVTIEAKTLTFRVRATDERYPLDRLNVFVNDVPVFGTAGLAISGAEVHEHEQEVEVPLVPGRNKVQVSVLNRQGAESLRQTAYTTSTAAAASADVYVLAIGVSRYRKEAYNLRFAAKDAADFAAAYRASGAREKIGGAVHVLDLTDEKATRTAIRQAKDWLQQARVNDLVVVFAAGHGMTDARQNYYFGTHDIDPERPEIDGLPYEDFEALLDGIRAMRKVLLIDTCFSGEIDKDEAIVVAQAQSGGAGTVSMRAFKTARGVNLVADDTPANGAPDSAASLALTSDTLRFQQELFADLRRGTGAVVISSASGNEYALEGEQWSNGVFTYALLDGLKNASADVNQDRTITVSELQAHVIDAVRKLTAGGQNPTVRRENLDYDFVVY